MLLLCEKYSRCKIIYKVLTHPYSLESIYQKLTWFQFEFLWNYVLQFKKIIDVQYQEKLQLISSSDYVVHTK